MIAQARIDAQRQAVVERAQAEAAAIEAAAQTKRRAAQAAQAEVEAAAQAKIDAAQAEVRHAQERIEDERQIKLRAEQQAAQAQLEARAKAHATQVAIEAQRQRDVQAQKILAIQQETATEAERLYWIQTIQGDHLFYVCEQQGRGHGACFAEGLAHRISECVARGNTRDACEYYSKFP